MLSVDTSKPARRTHECTQPNQAGQSCAPGAVYSTPVCANLRPACCASFAPLRLSGTCAYRASQSESIQTCNDELCSDVKQGRPAVVATLSVGGNESNTMQCGRSNESNTMQCGHSNESNTMQCCRSNESMNQRRCNAAAAMNQTRCNAAAAMNQTRCNAAGADTVQWKRNGAVYCKGSEALWGRGYARSNPCLHSSSIGL